MKVLATMILPVPDLLTQRLQSPVELLLLETEQMSPYPQGHIAKFGLGRVGPHTLLHGRVTNAKPNLTQLFPL